MALARDNEILLLRIRLEELEPAQLLSESAEDAYTPDALTSNPTKDVFADDISNRPQSSSDKRLADERICLSSHKLDYDFNLMDPTTVSETSLKKQIGHSVVLEEPLDYSSSRISQSILNNQGSDYKNSTGPDYGRNVLVELESLGAQVKGTTALIPTLVLFIFRLNRFDGL
jgi:hypothetical protein